MLYINRDGTCSSCEHDSTSWYVLHHGPCKIHAYTSHFEKWSFWMEFDNWGFLKDKQLVRFIGRDTLVTYPGSNNIGVVDASTHFYVRSDLEEPNGVRSRIGRPRPPRVRQISRNAYHVRLDSLWWSLVWSKDRFRQWMDFQYPSSVRDRYPYRHDQIPAAVLGDFDADSTVDVAMHGFVRDDFGEGRIFCVLSNRGRPTLIELLRDPTLLVGPKGGFREPHPTRYLRLIRAGEEWTTQAGKAIRFQRDAILVSSPAGYGTPYVYGDGVFREGSRLVTDPWDPLSPRE